MDATFRSWRAWSGGNNVELHKYAQEEELVAPLRMSPTAAPGGSKGAEALLKATRAVPIVFAIVPDPVGAGIVERLSRPGGNATGFAMFEYNLCGKWLELFREIAPSVKQAAVLRDPGFAHGISQVAVIQAIAQLVGIEVSPIDLHEPDQIERAIASLAQYRPNGGLIVAASGVGATNIKLIIATAARHKLPAVYIQRAFVAARRIDLLWAKF